MEVSRGDKIECEKCGTEKVATTHGQKYCSLECARTHKTSSTTRGTEGKCKHCEEQFTRSRSGQDYCSVSCANKHQYQTGYRDKDKQTDKANEALRRQGVEQFKESPTTRISKRGYRLIYIPSAYADQHDDLESGWMKMHHYVWWKEKDELPPVNDLQEEGNGVVMHHKDGDKLNNDIENLELMKNGEHVSIHAQDK